MWISKRTNVFHRDTNASALAISVLDGRNKRVIYKAKPGDSLANAHVSRDLSMVMVRLNGPEGKVTRFVIRSDGTGYRELSLLSGSVLTGKMLDPPLTDRTRQQPPQSGGAVGLFRFLDPSKSLTGWEPAPPCRQYNPDRALAH